MKSLIAAVSLSVVTIVMAFGSAQADPLGGIATYLFTQELPKCVNGVGVPGGCVGPNGEIVKAAGTALNDLTHGAGDHNDIVGRHGWLRSRLGF